MTFDEQYRDLLFRVITDGHKVSDRTGVGCRKLFGQEMRFDLSEQFPIPTLKKLFFETAKNEMLWIYQDQSNDVSLLREKYGVNVWNEWELPDGTIGNAYGFTVKKYDQINTLIRDLLNNPFSRRHIMSLWDIEELPNMSLQPCAFQTIWGVIDGRLNCQLIQRSGDLGLGVPFNTSQYAILVHMLAQVTNLKVGELVHTITDAHIYENHIEPLKEMLFRPIMKDVKPQLILSPGITDFYDFKTSDIILTGYDSHPHIPLDVAI